MKEPEPRPRRLVHFTPLRYPGGKGKLAAYVKQIIRENKLYDGEYVSPTQVARRSRLNCYFKSMSPKSISTT